MLVLLIHSNWHFVQNFRAKVTRSMNEREINKPFKRRNWNLTEDALNLLTHYLQKANPRDATGTLSKIIGSIDRSSVKDSIVDSDIISKVLDTLTLSTNGSLSFFSVLDVFKVPSFDFNLSTRKLEPYVIPLSFQL